MSAKSIDPEVESDDSMFSLDERRLVTQAYDMAVQTLNDQWLDDTLVLPDIQREYIWDNGKASRLIESLILRVPIPNVYFAERDDSKYEIIDGHQRIRSVVRYMDNQFRLSSLWVLHEYLGKRFHQLPDHIQRHIRTRIMRAVVIQPESHPDMKFEVFERLNQGSISLTPQELRNSMYRGVFNRFLRSSVKEINLRKVIGTAKARRRMVDEELLLRLLALREDLPNYRSPMKRFLNKYMGKMREANQEQLSEFGEILERTTALVHRILGNTAFRITDSRGVPRDKLLNRALFEAQMLGFSWIEDGRSCRKASVVSALAQLFGDQAFLDAIQKATGNKSNVDLRTKRVVDALTSAGADMNVPFEFEAGQWHRRH